MFNLNQYNEELISQRQQGRQFHRANCSGCNCANFDESQYSFVNRELLKNLNSMSVPQLYQTFQEFQTQGVNFQPVIRDC